MKPLQIFLAAAGLVTVAAGCTSAAKGANQAAPSVQSAHARTVIRIGHQKYGNLTILKAWGTVEKRLEPLGVGVQWFEFPAGPQLLEALNAGAVDFGEAGEAPPVFAQAAAASAMVYVATTPPRPQAEAIVVPSHSPIRSVQDLKGKKVALNKGSNVHYLLVKALEAAGLKWTDIQPVYLPPAEARAAFQGGSVDAWVIWDPFLAAAEEELGVRVVADGTGLVANRGFYLARRDFAAAHAEVLGAVLAEVARVDEWAKLHPQEMARTFAPVIGISASAVERAERRLVRAILPLDEQVIQAQQAVADTFYRLGLIPRAIQVRDAVVAIPIGR